MLVDLKQFLYDSIANQLIVNHLDKKVKMDVVEPDKVGEKFKNAVSKDGSVKDLKGADWIIRFAEPVVEEQPKDDEEKETADNDASEEKKTEETPDMGTEETADEESTEEVNESIKVQDLTKSMLSNPKVTKLSCDCGAKPKMVKEGEKKAKKEDDEEEKKSEEKKEEKPVEKKDDEKTEEKATEEKKDEEKKVEEAETEASGDELKIKVAKALAKVFEIDKDKVDLVDVPECIEGYNVYYCKLTFKDHEGRTEEEK